MSSQERQEVSATLARRQTELAVVSATLSQLRERREDTVAVRQRLQTAHTEAKVGAPSSSSHLHTITDIRIRPQARAQAHAR